MVASPWAAQTKIHDRNAQAVTRRNYSCSIDAVIGMESHVYASRPKLRSAAGPPVGPFLAKDIAETTTWLILMKYGCSARNTARH
jgi:hypothetical protein